MSLVIETSTAYFYDKSDSAIEAQANGAFKKILKANGAYSGTVTGVDTHFESMSTKTIR